MKNKTMKEEIEIINKIRKIYNWNCPYQSVRFCGYSKNGNREYLLSQMGNDKYIQFTVEFYDYDEAFNENKKVDK
jgi:hypothetical protein